MRISRSIQLFPESGLVHQYWRCHNRENYLFPTQIKDMYFKCCSDALMATNKEKRNLVIHAFCIMSNHFHAMFTYFNGSISLSNFSRRAHGRFGAKYNKYNKRSGKVAEGRPKTPLVESKTHEMRVQFYIEANPIRANMCTLSGLKSYKYCSYAYYAYGIKNELTNILTPPDWYVSLGRTPKDRQKKYRKLFMRYLARQVKTPRVFFGLYIGTAEWIAEKKVTVRQLKYERSLQRKALLYLLNESIGKSRPPPGLS